MKSISLLLLTLLVREASAQTTFAIAAGALLRTPAHGSATAGPTIGVQLGRTLAAGTQVRMTGEFAGHGGRDLLLVYPCLAPGPCPSGGPMAPVTTVFVGTELTVAPGGGGPYLLVGTGGRWSSKAQSQDAVWHPAVRAGVGVAARAGRVSIFAEGKVERVFAAGVLPRWYVPLTAGIRIGGTQ